MHGGVAKTELGHENVEAVKAGIANLLRHIENVRKFGVPVDGRDQPLHRRYASRDRRHRGSLPPGRRHGASLPPLGRRRQGRARRWRMRWCELADSGAARLQAALSRRPAAGRQDPHRRARDLSRRATSAFAPDAAKKLKQYESRRLRPFAGLHGQDAVQLHRRPRGCAARRPASSLPVRDVRLSAGAGFVVALCGDIMTMPGLPRDPAAYRIRIDADGQIDGLF